MATLTELRDKFKQGRQPTGQDFVDLINAFLAADGSNWPKELPASSGKNLTNIPFPDPLPEVDGSALKNININEYYVPPIDKQPQYASATSIVVTGDERNTYLDNIRLRLKLNTGYFYSSVLATAYDAMADVTTIELAEAMPNNTLTEGAYCIFRPVAAGGGVTMSLMGAPFHQSVAKVAGFSIDAADMGRLFRCDTTAAGFDATLPDPSAAGNGWSVVLYNTGTANALFIKNHLGIVLDMLVPGEGALFACDGASYSQMMLTRDMRPGTVFYYTGDTAPYGAIKAKGLALLRNDYPALWAHAQASNNITDEATWAASRWGAYSTGDLASNFRIPKLNGEFVRVWDDGAGIDSGRTLGGSQLDAFQGHKHGWTGASTAASGQFNATANYSDSNPYANNVIAPASDGVNGTPRTAAETRPRSIALLACIKF